MYESRIKEFHERVKLPIDAPLNYTTESSVQTLRHAGAELDFIGSAIDVEDLRTFRAREMVLELSEVLEALEKCNRLKLLDGICDMVYFLIGTAVTFGLPFDKAFERVHASNMTKEPDYPRFKGPNYRRPELEDLL